MTFSGSGTITKSFSVPWPLRKATGEVCEVLTPPSYEDGRTPISATGTRAGPTDRDGSVPDLRRIAETVEALQLRDEPVAEVLLLLEKLDLIHAHATGGKEVDLGARDE